MSLDKGTYFSKDGPGKAISEDGGILANPELLWIDDEWTEERTEKAKLALRLQAENGTSPSEFWIQKYQTSAEKYWYEFYKRNKTNFYKDRHYLHIVFPELAPTTDNDYISRTKLLEVGCGVGNAALPLLECNANIDITCIDFANSAIQLLQEEIMTYNSKPNLGGTIVASRCDITKDSLPVADNSQDLILCMFVISAIEPKVSTFRSFKLFMHMYILHNYRIN